MFKKYKWDCLWLDDLCSQCEFYHRLVEGKAPPECPRGLEPNWRRIE